MKLILDTSVFLWMILGEEEHFTKKALKALQESDILLLSTVSTWEISIKYSLKKLQLKPNPDRWLPDVISKMELQSLPVSQAHTLALMPLPDIHKDPFDRLLIAQAKVEKIPILSPDKIFKKYPIQVIW